MVKFCEQAATKERGYRADYECEKARLTFNSHCSQIDPIRKTLLTQRNDHRVEPFEVKKRLDHVNTLLENFENELESLRMRIPNVCQNSRTGTPNKNILFFLTTIDVETRSILLRYLH